MRGARRAGDDRLPGGARVVDIRPIDAKPTAEERAAVDGAIGAPTSAWDGGARGSDRDAHTALGGASVRGRRHELVPALQALQSHVGWISEGGLGYVCDRLNVPPADAWGVATFYALLATTPRPKRVLHVCSDIACRIRGSHDIERALEAACGPAITRAPSGNSVTLGEHDHAWMHSPCLGLCDHAPAALLTVAGDVPRELSLGSVTPQQALHLVAASTLVIPSEARDLLSPDVRNIQESDARDQKQILRSAQDDKKQILR
ncbi:MAG: NAD(P)H-dependent oxidoreductase subunit E, partial [bacterium]